MAYEVDGRTACAACGTSANERSRTLGSAVLALVSVGYLTTLALGYVVFKARPFVGGLAAVVAIAIGRVLQGLVRFPKVARRFD